MHFEGADSLYEVVCCMHWLKCVGYKCYKFGPCCVGCYALQMSYLFVHCSFCVKHFGCFRCFREIYYLRAFVDVLDPFCYGLGFVIKYGEFGINI